MPAWQKAKNWFLLRTLLPLATALISMTWILCRPSELLTRADLNLAFGVCIGFGFCFLYNWISLWRFVIICEREEAFEQLKKL